jgi:cytidylate kinase
MKQKQVKRSIEHLVEEQLSKWTLLSKEEKSPVFEPKPIITVSREPGSGGTEIASKLSAKLKMDLISGQISQQIAESVQMSERVIRSLDEKEITKRDDWLTSLFETRHLWPDQFLFHLTKVIGTVGRHGNAVILGRGAQYVLPPEKTFRIRLIGPLDIRIQRIMNAKACSRREAEQYAITTESDRRAFIQKYFNADVTNPYDYDLFINMGKIPIDGAVDTIVVAFEAWKKEKNL